MSDKPATLYRFYDVDRRLLYVGISKSWWKRIMDHYADKWWWWDAVSIHLEHFDSQKAAKKAESHAIKTEAPLFNLAEQKWDGPWDLDFEVILRFEPALRSLAEECVGVPNCPMSDDFWDSIEDDVRCLIGPKRGRNTNRVGESVLKESMLAVLDSVEQVYDAGALVPSTELMLREEQAAAFVLWTLKFVCGKRCHHDIENFHSRWYRTVVAYEDSEQNGDGVWRAAVARGSRTP